MDVHAVRANKRDAEHRRARTAATRELLCPTAASVARLFCCCSCRLFCRETDLRAAAQQTIPTRTGFLLLSLSHTFLIHLLSFNGFHHRLDSEVTHVNCNKKSHNSYFEIEWDHSLLELSYYFDIFINRSRKVTLYSAGFSESCTLVKIVLFLDIFPIPRILRAPKRM